MNVSPVPRSQAERSEALHEIFEAQADMRPDDVAVEVGRERVTYIELERRANRLARHLRARGVGVGSLVALLLPRSVDAYAALLGVLKAGAAYVPIDPEYPADRVTCILRDSGATALLTTERLSRSVTRFGGFIVRVDGDRPAIAVESSSRLPEGTVARGG